MAQFVANVEHVWSAFRALPPASRDEFLERLLADEALRQEIEDLMDLTLAQERSHESVRPLEDVLAELEK